MLFTLLAWARTNETRFASWAEFKGLDTAQPLWRVPAERMKMEREHLVPLSREVEALLQRLPSYGGSGFVYPGDKLNQPPSQNTMIYACYRVGYRGRQTAHGFRGLASTWANEAGQLEPNSRGKRTLVHVAERGCCAFRPASRRCMR
jgi:integrase